MTLFNELSMLQKLMAENHLLSITDLRQALKARGKEEEESATDELTVKELQHKLSKLVKKILRRNPEEYDSMVGVRRELEAELGIVAFAYDDYDEEVREDVLQQIELAEKRLGSSG